MPIMKKKVYENFTVVDNYYIDDIECKPECMGYLTYMLRKPENWNFTFKSIMKDLGVESVLEMKMVTLYGFTIFIINHTIWALIKRIYHMYAMDMWMVNIFKPTR